MNPQPADVDKRPLASGGETPEGPPTKKAKSVTPQSTTTGLAPVKPQFLLQHQVEPKPPVRADLTETVDKAVADGSSSAKRKKRGQNKARRFHTSSDSVKLCQSLVLISDESAFASTVCEYATKAARNENGPGDTHAAAEVAPTECPPKAQGPKCKFEHNLREYLRRKCPDLPGVCPVWEKRGVCAAGWRCRWLHSHCREVDGALQLLMDEQKMQDSLQGATGIITESDDSGKLPKQDFSPATSLRLDFDDPYGETFNNVSTSLKIQLRKNLIPLKRSEFYQSWLDERKDVEDQRALYVEPPLRPEEKRRLDINGQTPLLAPLTTTGNLPFRRLCVGLGASITYSEMAMSASLLQGHKPEWALLRAHASEIPNFGAQICANKVSQAVRTTEAVCQLLSGSRSGLALVDLNCGCPIDLVYQQGGGSALMDQPGKLIKILKGMNYVSGDIPVTCKIRMGTRDSSPTAQKLIQKVIGAGDVQAITLHGRSRQQRYSRAADWSYIAETAALVKSLKSDMDKQTDTANDKERPERRGIYLIGNGDCYSHFDYTTAIKDAEVDSVMIARGALIKPWIFEEIQSSQYLDKSSSQRLDLIRDYCRYGLECWGADEWGVATTRKFLLEWLSFTCRYVPIGILERLPPRIQDRPPAWQGRNEMETLLASNDCRDWIKISEMFLGPCPPDFFFTPKHKSNAYEMEAEG